MALPGSYQDLYYQMLLSISQVIGMSGITPAIPTFYLQESLDNHSKIGTKL
jgi:hypothetical protein